MRPLKLQMTNFASFRGAHTVDFADINLFVLSGATGAGKSSIIDSMCFALYGQVPRFDDARSVAPVISTGTTQARVQLEFLVGDEAYTVVRVVERTTRAGEVVGATTKEARLERQQLSGAPSTVMAGSAKQVTAAVEKLLGLTFTEFTRTVVLPQGDFAEFLHAKRKDRQDLMVRLLGLEVYRELGTEARSRSNAGVIEVEQLNERLSELSDLTNDQLEDAQQRVEDLGAAQQAGEALLPELDELTDLGAELASVASAKALVAEQLGKVKLPADVSSVAGDIAAADGKVAAAAAAAEAARAGLDELDAKLDTLGDESSYRSLRAARDDLAATIAREENLNGQLAAVREKSEREQATAAAAKVDLDAATAALDLARRHSAAAALASATRPGDDCPVCLRAVEDMPVHDGQVDLDAAAHRVTEAEQAYSSACELADTTAARVVRGESTVTSCIEERQRHQQRVDQLSSSLAAEGLSDDDLDTRLASFESLRSEATAARSKASEAAQQLRAAQTGRASLDEAARSAWSMFHTVRDAVASLGAPAGDPDDLANSWQRLCDWAEQQKGPATEAAAAAQDKVAEARNQWSAKATQLRQIAADVGVSVDPSTRPVTTMSALSSALTAAQLDARRIAEGLERADKLRERVTECQTSVARLKMVGDLLRVTKFEQWLLNRLSQQLVVGASDILRDLTDSTYSLALDEDGSFTVVDHSAGDQVRPAKTLSGGETFLASLALALALAEHVAGHSSAVGRLESLFLDEGFGTLDPSMLDRVAASIEELSNDRMVGVITHVDDLAERIPVKFEVSRTPTGSTVSLQGAPAADVA